MPSEIRHVIFSTAEVLEAVVAHARRAGRPLPIGAVTAAQVRCVVPGAPVSFRVEIAPDSAQAEAPARVLEFQAEELAAALLGYCRSRGIPVAMRAEKALHKFGQRLGLVLTLGASPAERVMLDAGGGH